jgi:hypothetical protein
MSHNLPNMSDDSPDVVDAFNFQVYGDGTTPGLSIRTSIIGASRESPIHYFADKWSPLIEGIMTSG